MPKVHFSNTQDCDMYYLVQTRIPDPFFYIDTGAKKYVILNGLEIGAFNEHNKNSAIESVSMEPLWNQARGSQGGESSGNKFAFAVFEKYGLLGQPVEVARTFPLDTADYLRSRGVQLVVKSPFLPERLKKTSEEILYIRKNIALTHGSFDLIRKILRESEIKDDTLIYAHTVLTSEFVKEEIEKQMLEQGMEDVEGMIISSGAQASMPHHKGSGPLRANETIICDLFFRSRSNKYYADMTRTYVKGKPTETAQRMFDAVKSAQDAAFAAIRPGVAAADVHAVAAKAITDAGFDSGEKGFIHGLGHGLGLALHEPPNAGSNSKDILEVGNVITIEPGLYYPEFGGVRLEDVVVVTAHGFENLTNYEREFVIP